MNAVAQQTIVFLNDLIQAVNKTPPSQTASASALSGYQASLATARSESVGAITAVTGAKSAYDSALAGANTSANSAGSGTQSDIAVAAASLKQAQGALDAAKAALDKTLVRSPISGTIVSLPVTKGDFVSAYSQVAVVSNPGALYVAAQVTPSDAKSLSTGNAAVIDGAVRGVITFVAPALDPATNKIEVKIGIQGDASALTDGEVVSVALDRNEKQAGAGASANAGDAIAIPIIAAKISPTGPVVFTVTASSTLSAVPIRLGSILGDRITVLSGLSLDTEIVTDARGLAEGQTVVVD
jgi:RND family efflux transporter MFP subunit